MSNDGRRKLRNTGVAPPQSGQLPPRAVRRAAGGVPAMRSEDTEVLSEFGSTSCKALWRCKSCRETVRLIFKCH